MTLPNFLIIGAAKCATSSLRALLAQHPQLFLARGGRETRFFADDRLYGLGLPAYESEFTGAGGRSAIGECSNVYTERKRFPQAAQRIARELPDAKLVYMVREPLSRIESLWLQLRSHGGEAVHFDFNRALVENRAHLVDSTNYWRQLQPYRDHFPADRIQVLFFEDYRADPSACARRCLAFLGVDPDVEFERSVAHQNPSQGKLGPPAWLSRLRSAPGFAHAKRLLPAAGRHALKRRVLFQRMARPVWDPAVRAGVLDELGDDCRRLLAECGRPASFWDLD